MKNERAITNRAGQELYDKMVFHQKISMHPNPDFLWDRVHFNNTLMRRFPRFRNEFWPYTPSFPRSLNAQKSCDEASGLCCGPDLVKGTAD